MTLASSRWVRSALLLVVAAMSYVMSVCVEEGHYIYGLVAALAVFGFGGVELYADEWFGAFKSNDQISDRAARRLASKATVKQVEKAVGDLLRDLQISADHELHATVHLAIRRSDCCSCQVDWSFVQLIDYQGRRPRGKNRTFNVYKGLIGASFRAGKPMTVNFGSADEYSRRMVEDFGYFPNEAQYHADARSYYARPVGVDGEAIGVLYLYSKRTNCFPEDPNDVRQQDRYDDACQRLGSVLSDDPLVRRARSTT